MSAPFSLSIDPTPSFWRSLQTLNISRVVVAASLLILLNLTNTKETWLADHLWMRDVCFVYLIVSVGFVALNMLLQQKFLWQLTSQISIDILMIATLYMTAGGSRSGMGILFLFPLAGVAILSPLLWAFFFTSIVALFLLGESVYRILDNSDVTMISQSGLFGAAYFAVVYVVNRLANNLIRQEQLAAQRGNELAMQQAINRLVITDMGDGILVLDEQGRMFEINPAAERMLGRNLTKEMRGVVLSDVIALRPMVETITAMRDKMATQNKNSDEDISFVSIRSHLDETVNQARHGFESSDSGGRVERPHFVTHLKLRLVLVKENRFARIGVPAASYTIIFLQDVSDIENQAQQLKLASMGRLTASIAHEVRNPLSSISYAASLLNEDIDHLSDNKSQSVRLLKIVDDNVRRLNQLIEDILKLSRKARTDIEPYSLISAIKEFVVDFLETKEIAADLIRVSDIVDFNVSFDQAHLREVVINLLSNAIRYASGKPGSIRIFATIGINGRQELHIQDDGPGIAYDVRAHLFEPFYTTSRMGTGLGLYMARELCLNNRSLLDYEYRTEEHGAETTEPTGRFVINFSGYTL